LRELGYVEGDNTVIDFRTADGNVEKLPELAAALVRLEPALIVSSTDLATRAVKNATKSIPILMVAINYDPVFHGYVDSLARPGGNVTGVFFQHLGLLSKRLGLMKELAPAASRIAVFSDHDTVDQLKIVEAAAAALGFELQTAILKNPPYDFDEVFRISLQSHPEALFALEAASIFRGRAQIATLALANRLPSSFAFREYVDAGGLFSYGVSFADMYRRAAEYADKILRGTKPIDLPVEQSTKFELVINQRTARVLGLAVPAAMLAAANEVIE